MFVAQRKRRFNCGLPCFLLEQRIALRVYTQGEYDWYAHLNLFMSTFRLSWTIDICLSKFNFPDVRCWVEIYRTHVVRADRKYSVKFSFWLSSLVREIDLRGDGSHVTRLLSLLQGNETCWLIILSIRHRLLHNDMRVVQGAALTLLVPAAYLFYQELYLFRSHTFTTFNQCNFEQFYQ